MIATRMYIRHAEPMLQTTTMVVRKWESFFISFRMENICEQHQRFGLYNDAGPQTFWWQVYAKTIIGNEENASIGPSHLIILTSPRSWRVSLLIKCTRIKMIT